MSEVVSGYRELEAKLQTLTGREMRRIVRNSTNKGLTVITKAIRSAAPVGKTRSVRKAIGKRFARNRRSGEMEAKAGIGVGKKRKADGTKARTAPHSHLVALGTKARFTKSGAKRGVMPQNDFVTKAFAAAQSTAGSVVLQEAWSGIKKASS